MYIKINKIRLQSVTHRNRNQEISDKEKKKVYIE